MAPIGTRARNRPAIDHEHGDEALTTNERYQTHSRRIQSKGDKHQVDHGQTGRLSLLALFDYEHEHRDAEHEHDNCVGIPERPAQAGRTRKICHVRAGGVRLRAIGTPAILLATQ